MSESEAKQEAAGLPYIRQPNLRNRVYDVLLTMIIDGKYKNNDTEIARQAALNAEDREIRELGKMLVKGAAARRGRVTRVGRAIVNG